MTDMVLDMALDDLVSSDRSYRGSGRRRGGKKGEGASEERRGGGRGRRDRKNARSSPYDKDREVNARDLPWNKPQRPSAADAEGSWKHDKFGADAEEEEARPQWGKRNRRREDDIQLGTRLLVANLHWEVDNEAVKELFERYGDVTSAKVIYDRTGRSNGEAEVVFHRKRDAETAVGSLDGKSLKGQALEVLLAPIELPAVRREKRTNDSRGNGRRGNNSRGGGRSGGRGGDRTVSFGYDNDEEMDDGPVVRFAA